MSWKRCWNNNHDNDDQIVPDIDRSPRGTFLTVSSSSSSSESSSSNRNHSISSNSTNNNSRYNASSSSTSSSSTSSSNHHRSPFKNSSNDKYNNHNNGMFSNRDKPRSGFRQHDPLTNSNNQSSFTWKTPFRQTDNDYFASSNNNGNNNGKNHHHHLHHYSNNKISTPLNSNDFWEEKYSRIAVITATAASTHPLATTQQLSKY